MGGVVIGSSMELVSLGQRWLAPTINTGCNLNCPMCYLGHKAPLNQTMTLKTAEQLASTACNENLDGVAIIGTEPLLNEESVGVINVFVPVVRTHIITNGVNLEKFANKIRQVKRVDISLDGGPKTYPRGSFMTIYAGVEKWRNSSNSDQVYAINTLYGENLSNIEDMLEGSRLLGVKGTFFSPYVRTLGGCVGVTPLGTAEIIQALRPFTGENWKLLIDPYHAIFEWRKWDAIKNDANIIPPKNRLIINFDPGERVQRVGVDGSKKHPFMALHPGIEFI